MPEFAVPVILQVKGYVTVVAKSKTEAIAKTTVGDYIDVDVEVPIDIVDIEFYLEAGEEDEVESVGQNQP